MRIAVLVASRLKGQGGKESAIRQVAAGLAVRGHSVSVVLVGPCVERTWEHTVSPLFVGPMGAGWRSLRENIPGVLRFVAGVLAREQTELVVVTEPGGALVVRFASMARRVTRPVIVSWVHGDVSRINHTWATRLCDGHLAISEGIQKQLCAKTARPVRLVHNPIEPAGAPCLRPSSGEPLRFVFIGRLEHQKRVDLLLTALSRVRARNWTADVIGDGTLRAAMENLSHRLGLDDQVRWRGWRPDPWVAVPAASALLLTSEMEGFPIVLLEAIARGVPVVAMDCDFGPREIVVEGENGWLIPAADCASFASTLDRLCAGALTLPPTEAVTATSRRFSAEKIVARIDAALVDIARRSRLASAG